ncbi:MAG TPA: hypothetical protein VFU45_07270 [Gemmatimonadales bacterium]|nr:hypothetical protein [Gemmatimonadales bacterium]
MKHRSTIVLALAAAVATSAAAQGPCGMKGPHLPAAGEWSEYQTARGTMKMAYLGHESGGDRIEMQMTSDRGNMIMQVVVDGFPYDSKDIHEAVIKLGDRPAMKAPQMMLDRMGGNSAITKDMCGSFTKVGDESVTVPAGTFKATHYKFSSERTINGMDMKSSGDIWISADVPFGLVKEEGTASGMRGDTQTSMALTAKGSGAKSSITEKPQDMGGMMMGPPPKN